MADLFATEKFIRLIIKVLLSLSFIQELSYASSILSCCLDHEFYFYYGHILAIFTMKDEGYWEEEWTNVPASASFVFVGSISNLEKVIFSENFEIFQGFWIKEIFSSKIFI